MEFTINADMTITQVAGGLILVAHLSWMAAAIALVLIVLVINRILPGSLPYTPAR